MQRRRRGRRVSAAAPARGARRRRVASRARGFPAPAVARPRRGAPRRPAARSAARWPAEPQAVATRHREWWESVSVTPRDPRRTPAAAVGRGRATAPGKDVLEVSSCRCWCARGERSRRTARSLLLHPPRRPPPGLVRVWGRTAASRPPRRDGGAAGALTLYTSRGDRSLREGARVWGYGLWRKAMSAPFRASMPRAARTRASARFPGCPPGCRGHDPDGRRLPTSFPSCVGAPQTHGRSCRPRVQGEGPLRAVRALAAWRCCPRYHGYVGAAAWRAKDLAFHDESTRPRACASVPTIIRRGHEGRDDLRPRGPPARDAVGLGRGGGAVTRRGRADTPLGDRLVRPAGARVRAPRCSGRPGAHRGRRQAERRARAPRRRAHHALSRWHAGARLRVARAPTANLTLGRTFAGRAIRAPPPSEASARGVR